LNLANRRATPGSARLPCEWFRRVRLRHEMAAPRDHDEPKRINEAGGRRNRTSSRSATGATRSLRPAPPPRGGVYDASFVATASDDRLKSLHKNPMVAGRSARRTGMSSKNGRPASRSPCSVGRRGSDPVRLRTLQRIELAANRLSAQRSGDRQAARSGPTAGSSKWRRTKTPPESWFNRRIYGP